MRSATGSPGGVAGDDAGLELRGLEKRFGETAAVAGLDLDLGDGELLTLLGPSGCGKTTVLRLVAGFERPDAGTVRFAGRDVTRWTPQRRGFGMVFQHYALFPHLTVFENVAFGLQARREPPAEISRRVERALARVDLPGFGERRVQELSGGQQQRVALARALAIEPPLLLLDEPLSNLDAALRERTRAEIRLLVKELGITALYVTHDQEEAFDLSDRVAVMEAGRLRQVGTPEELYDRPADRFVAGFVGRANVVEAALEAPPGEEGGVGRDLPERGGGGALVARLAGGVAWRLERDRLGGDLTGSGWREVDGRRAALVVRPEDMEIASRREGDQVLRGVVRDRRFRGAATAYRVQLASGSLLEVWGERGRARPGDQVALALRPGGRVHVFLEGAGE